MVLLGIRSEHGADRAMIRDLAVEQPLLDGFCDLRLEVVNIGEPATYSHPIFRMVRNVGSNDFCFW